MCKILKGAEFSAHLDQYRLHPGAVKFVFAYDPKDHTNRVNRSTLWAPDYATADAIARQMCREFGMQFVELEHQPGY